MKPLKLLGKISIGKILEDICWVICTIGLAPATNVV